MADPKIAGVSYSSNDEFAESSLARQAFVAWTVLYGFAIAAAKWAILLLYLRVFTMHSRPFSNTVYVMGFIITITAVINTLVAIFQCSPVAAAWQSSNSRDAKPASCLNMAAFDEYIAIPNVITGVVMILMPLPPVLRLNVPTLQKIALSATFLHGAIGLFASSARLYILSHPSSSPSSPIVSTIYTINEPANYIIAACLPTLRPIFVAILPERFFILSRHRASARSSTPYTKTALKISWPRGRLVPRLTLERGDSGWWGQLDSPAGGESAQSGSRARKGSWGRDVERALGGVIGKGGEGKRKVEVMTTSVPESIDATAMKERDGDVDIIEKTGEKNVPAATKA